MARRPDRRPKTVYRLPVHRQDYGAWLQSGDDDYIRGFLGEGLDPQLEAHIDPHLTAEAARLAALKSRQDLAVQMLSISNSQSRAILSLFRPLEPGALAFDYPPTERQI
ncbi:hypothetical protein [Rhizobium halophytocola]|uniref:Uncharacterized protein n=1 Tax=Rhizobium halophytocola TaxID=735519 RepID=A0ABS4DYQ9_9HYPH|nr:hypothetical protein [Rhizobium halophytocola]MBP1850825.1 hypothetical protein [Rhizobium halophytocola]